MTYIIQYTLPWVVILQSMKVYSKITTLSLAFLMLFNAFYKTLTVAYYYIDRSDFIAQFCENIDKPELKCNGKCHLKEVVKEDTDLNQNTPSTKNTFKEITLYFEKAQTSQLKESIEEVSLLIFHIDFYQYLDISEIYHPPEFL